MRRFIIGAATAALVLGMVFGGVSVAHAEVEYASDTNVVLLEHFNGTFNAPTDWLWAAPSWAKSRPGLGQAFVASPDQFVRYAVLGWHGWADGYDPTGKQGTIECWVRPRVYGSTLLALSWNQSDTDTPDGHIFSLSTDATGHLTVGTWTSVDGCPAGMPLTSTGTLPLNEWSHVAFSWGTAGTFAYVNGQQAASAAANLYPALNQINYLYVPMWTGLPAHDLDIDELRVSRIQRSDFNVDGSTPTDPSSATAGPPNASKPVLGEGTGQFVLGMLVLLAIAGVAVIAVAIMRSSKRPSVVNPDVSPSPHSAPAGWFPDPHSRHELRYWDGQNWTNHVSTQGVQSVENA